MSSHEEYAYFVREQIMRALDTQDFHDLPKPDMILVCPKVYYAFKKTFDFITGRGGVTMDYNAPVGRRLFIFGIPYEINDHITEQECWRPCVYQQIGR